MGCLPTGFAPVRAENGRLETAIILLVDKIVGRFLAEDTRIFQALLLHSGLRHCVRYVDGQHLGEPVVTRLSMLLAWLRPRAVVMNNANPSFSITIGAR